MNWATSVPAASEIVAVTVPTEANVAGPVPSRLAVTTTLSTSVGNEAGSTVTVSTPRAALAAGEYATPGPNGEL